MATNVKPITSFVPELHKGEGEAVSFMPLCSHKQYNWKNIFFDKVICPAA
jgi:hypothetical protein